MNIMFLGIGNISTFSFPSPVTKPLKFLSEKLIQISTQFGAFTLIEKANPTIPKAAKIFFQKPSSFILLLHWRNFAMVFCSWSLGLIVQSHHRFPTFENPLPLRAKTKL